MPYPQNDLLKNPMLPVEIVLAPPWWYHHEGITFDEDFFYHPARRVEVERKMEEVLHQRWGRFGLGADHDRELPLVGAVHLAAGYLISEMLGCRVDYQADSPPQVVCANRDSLDISPDDAFESPAYKKLEDLSDTLKTRFGYLAGDVNWSGILNIALDLRGQTFFMDMVDKPDAAARLIADIGTVIDRFTTGLSAQTGSTSISVNRTVGHIERPVFLHSECSHVMVSVADYEKFLMPLDIEWSRRRRPFGIHYCGKDPHRYAESFAKLPRLDFLDVGSGGDVAVLRRHLPNTFLNLRYSPVDIVGQTPDQIRQSIRGLVHASENPRLTGVCCINMDEQVTDEQITAIFEEVEALREEYAAR
jgi:hypothetical protein